MLEKSIKELGLSKEAYLLLITNGIKKISSLTTMSYKELLNLRMPYTKFNQSMSEQLVKEIIDKLKIYDLNIDNQEKQDKLLSEIRIQDTELSNRIIYRLGIAGIVTLGKLSTLSKYDILRIRNLGQGAYNEIKALEDKIEGFHLGTDQGEMIRQGLDEEEIYYYETKRKEMFEEDKNFEQNRKRREILLKENYPNKEKFLQMTISSLAIPIPIVKNGIYTGKTTIRTLLQLIPYTIENRVDIQNELNKLNIPNLALGMNLDNLIIGKNKIEEIEEYARSIYLRVEEKALINKKTLQKENDKREEVLLEYTRLQNKELENNISLKQKVLEQLELALKEKEKLESINNELSKRMEELSKRIGIEVNEDGQGQSTK